MKIASWNVNSLRVRLPQVLSWLQETNVDILGIQETKVEDDSFPINEIKEAGFFCEYIGQKTYNGVTTISKILQMSLWKVDKWERTRPKKI